MGLSRLENFLKSIKGTTIHVNGDSLDATDSIENNGSSIARPFKNIQRALVEAVRFSYRSGVDNDIFGRTTIVVHPSQYDIDNRPGILVKDDGSMVYRNGSAATLSEWSLPTNFNVYDQNNELYKLNSVHGGVILPRGVTLWAYDLRKTIIRPLYVPSPTNNEIERSSILRLTGAALPEGFTYFDANPNGFCYKDYTTNKFTPNFSHHKLSCFLYVDGINPVVVNDDFLNVTTTRTDLEMYYEKVAKVYGDASGREIQDAIYSTGVYLDLEPVIDEVRIVGSRGREVGITSIRAGNGVTPSTTITVNLAEEVEELSVDTPIQISGVGVPGYDGQYVVYSVVNSTEVQYKSSILPTNPLPSTLGSTLNIVVDTVTSASPYIKKNTLRSVYGMCGYHADGSNVSGFKSSVVSEFTGVSVQKDDNAFVKYDPISGTYKDSTSISNLHKDSRARYKPDYEHYHIKLTNDAFAELVSTFAIGFAKQYNVESGGDITVNASKSDFGAKAFVADGFRKEAFLKDDLGCIVGYVPPREITNEPFNIEFTSFDVGLTTAVGNNSRLYLAEANNVSIVPSYSFDGYKIGAKQNEVISLEISNGSTVGVYTASVFVPNVSTSYEKSYTVERVNGNTENSISNNTLSLTTNHLLSTGEKIRVISSNGHLPDGLTPHVVGYAITTSLPANRIKIAPTYNDALSGNAITLNRKGGTLNVVSRVSDKLPGEFGHPIQWDETNSNWYLTVNSGNAIYSQLSSLGVSKLGKYTPRSYFERRADFRSEEDKIFKLRYVIPKNTSVSARPPLEAYTLQESNTTKLTSNDIQKYFASSTIAINSSDELRNPHYISDVKWSSNYATVYTEIPHNLSIGSKVETINVIDDEYVVSEIVSPTAFKVPLTTNPGTFNKNTSARNDNLPYFKRLETSINYQVYKVNELQEYIYNKQDGVYDLIIVNNSNSPQVEPFTELKFSQPIENLYPQLDRDNISSDPAAATCFALPDRIGEVVVNDEKLSITKETFGKFLSDFNVGIAVTGTQSSVTGLAHTFFTSGSHNISGVSSVSIISSGANYVPGTYFGADLITSTGVGRNAKVRVDVNGSGNVTNVIVMEGGCAYGVGNTSTIVPAAGLGTTTGFIPAVVEVTRININTNDTLFIFGNDVPYRIAGVSSHNQIQVASASTVTSAPTGYAVASISIPISTFTYTATTGIATITFAASHPFLLNNKVTLGGFDSSYFNQSVIVDSVPNINSIVVNLGKNGGSLPTTGNRYGFLTISSNKGRPIYYYGGKRLRLTAELSFDSTNDIIQLTTAVGRGLNVGDYLRVNDEILRIKSNVTSDSVSVQRAQLGTQKQTHPNSSLAYLIKVIPIELRRGSMIRSSSHTLEYVGFGPGNYSTALPDKQDRKLSNKERSLAYAFKTSGGVVYYSANDENGDIYNTNKKVYSLTGKEEVYDTPVLNVAGEKITYDTVRTSNAVIDKNVKVSGGEDGNSVSEFYGPIVLNNKLTSYSSKGIEASHFLIQGSEKTSRKIGITASIPTGSGGYGDILFNSSPNKGEYIGWTYTIENQWEGFGGIGSNVTANNLTVSGITTFNNTSVFNEPASFNDNVSITGITNGALLRVTMNSGSGQAILVEDQTNPDFSPFLVDFEGKVGIGTTAPRSKLHVADGAISLDNNQFIFFGSSNVSLIRGADGTSANPFLGFRAGTGNPDTMTLLGNGNLGIGSTTPRTRLDVNGSASITGIATIGLNALTAPGQDSQFSFELPSNNTLRVRVRGADGVTRTGIITLS